MTTVSPPLRLTQFAQGGGCACKIPPGDLEDVLGGLGFGMAGGDLLVGLDHGDDAAAVRIDGGRAVIATADFFTPVVDDAYDGGGSRQPTRCPTSTRWVVSRWLR